MSAQEMCLIPTKDGAIVVPVGTAILLDDGTLGFAGKDGYWIRFHYVGNDYPFRYGDHTATAVAFPDGNGGWITPGAATPEWVPLTREQVALLPDRTPVRIEDSGVVIEGLFHRTATTDDQFYLHHEKADYRWAGRPSLVTVYARPQDDPGADLIERAAREIEEVISTSARWSDYQRAARRIIDLARGEQA